MKKYSSESDCLGGRIYCWEVYMGCVCNRLPRLPSLLFVAWTDLFGYCNKKKAELGSLQMKLGWVLRVLAQIVAYITVFYNCT